MLKRRKNTTLRNLHFSLQITNLIKNYLRFCIKKIAFAFNPPVVQPLLRQPLLGKFNILRLSQFSAIVMVIIFFSSCRKEQVVSGIVADTQVSDGKNASIKIDAGRTKRIVYPSSKSAILEGSGSDEDGPVTFKWKQTGGNSTATIKNPTKAVTDISNLIPGLYSFNLTVTGTDGGTRTDVAYVTVLEKVTWQVSGSIRQALVHPATGGSGPTAVIIAFHGHGGTDLGFAERAFEINWPEAIVVYPQGLPTQGNGDEQGKNSGWQHSVGEVNIHTGIKDQDLKFFDAMLPTLKTNYNANLNSVFIHGWSNGGNFIYDALWAARGNKIAALCPAGAALGTTNGKVPIPVIHVAGLYDTKLKFSKQEQSVKEIRELNDCSPNGTVWATGQNGILGTEYYSSDLPVVLLQYNGDHNYPFSVPPFIVQFFKQIYNGN